MSPEILKMLIENACSEGVISDSDKLLLSKKAQELGISPQELDRMIDSQLKKSSNDNEGSGFVTEDNTSSTSDNMESSGFVTENQQPESNNEGSGFLTAEPEKPVVNIKTEQPSQAPTFESKLTDLQELSSQGAMSTVYKGKLYGKWIIMKRIKPQFKDNPTYKSLFMKEFDNCYNLDHENIVKLLDKGEDSKGLYYTMEYVDGRSLSECIKNGELRSEKLIKSIIKQLCNALSYVHKKQIVHRDLKPDNIMITFRGDNVKILDFGIAYADSYDDNLIKVGTPKYAAPEQMTKGNLVDQRADIYAVGLILLEMATGSLSDREAKTVTNPNFKLVITKATKQNPEERYHDCEELLEDLNKNIVIPVTPDPTTTEGEETQALEKTTAVAATPEPEIEKPQTPENKPETMATNKSKKNLIPIIIILLLLIGLGLFFALRKTGDKPQTADSDDKTVINNPVTDNPVTNNPVNNNPVTDNPTNDNQNHNGKTVTNPDRDNNVPTEEEKKQNEEDSNLKELMNEADQLFDSKNVARAKTIYEKILQQKPNYSEATEKLNKCKQILDKAEIKKLTSGSENGKYGYLDENGYVIVDYLYEKPDKNVPCNTKGLLAVKKDGKWGVIDQATKLPVTKFRYERIIWIPNGYELVYNGVRQQNYAKIIDGKTQVTEK